MNRWPDLRGPGGFQGWSGVPLSPFHVSVQSSSVAHERTAGVGDDQADDGTARTLRRSPEPRIVCAGRGGERRDATIARKGRSAINRDLPIGDQLALRSRAQRQRVEASA